MLTTLLMVAAAPVVANKDPGPPPPLVHTYTPAAATVTGRYECRGDVVELQIEARDDHVTVTRYTVDGKPLAARELAVWNDWLSNLTGIDNHFFQCNPGIASITINGQSRTPGKYDYSVVVERGRVKYLR